jgi:hypothetical protein
MKKILILLFFATFWVVEMVFGQEHLAFGLKAKIDIGGYKNTYFVLSSSVGFAKQLNLWEKQDIGGMLSLQIGLNLYKGGLGNTKIPNRINDHQIDLYNTFAFTLGYKGDKIDWGKPLYTWNASNSTNLINPFQSSLSIATNSIWNRLFIAEDKTNRQNRAQQIGFASVSVNKVTIGYYNDGPPFSNWLGDGEDRYWTGGGLLHIGVPNIGKTQTIISFDRFTGYEKNTYEIANLLKFGEVIYKDILNSSYNRGRIQIKVIDNKSKVGYTCGILDDKYSDVQYWIHRSRGFPIHPNMYKLSLLIGAEYELTNKIK